MQAAEGWSTGRALAMAHGNACGEAQLRLCSPHRALVLSARAAELPVELLSRILLQAAGMKGLPSMPGLALAQMVRCSAVSQSWRAAVEAALEREHYVHLSSGQQPSPLTVLRSSLVQRWARHWQFVRIQDGGCGSYLREPCFRALLISSCPTLVHLGLHATRSNNGGPHPVAVAWLEAAAAVPRLQKLTCWGFVPASSLPAQLQSIYITDAVPGEHEIAALLVRLQACSQLHELTIEISGGHLHLCKDSLLGVQLPQGLRSLTLETMRLSSVSSSNFSWLAGPRPFLVLLNVWDESDGAGHNHCTRLVQHLHDSSALGQQDKLWLTIGEKGLPLAAQQLLARFSLAEFCVDLPPQHLVMLPKAPSINITWCPTGDPDKSAELSWAAVTQTPGRVRVRLQDIDLPSDWEEPGCELHILEAGSLPGAGPWRLEVDSAFTAVRGLPQGHRTDDSGHVLLNKAALDAGWT